MPRLSVIVDKTEVDDWLSKNIINMIFKVADIFLMSISFVCEMYFGIIILYKQIIFSQSNVLKLITKYIYIDQTFT